MSVSDWKNFSTNYDHDVISVTKFKNKRQAFMKEIWSGLVLNLGTWPTSYLNKDLIVKNQVIASDWSQDMLKSAEMNFKHNNLKYVLTDNRNLSFDDWTFDYVVSINSILPEHQADVHKMIKEVYRVLKNNGTFIALIPSYECNVYLNEEANAWIRIDHNELRCWDTTWWQCMQSLESLKVHLSIAWFNDVNISKMYFDDKEEVLEQTRLYWFDASKFLRFEHFLVCKKW